ncbi:MAG: dockerin type I domain-containing protein [Patescibacteria group bacterium]
MRQVRQALPLAAVIFVAVPFLASAADPSSANFKDTAPTFAPAAGTFSSPNYQVSGSVDFAVGKSDSASFTVQSGVPFPDPAASPTPPTPPGGGGGGGGGTIGYVTPPTFTYKTPTFQSHQLIQGTRGNQSATVSVNGSEVGVSYPTASTWTRDLPLFLGLNAIEVRSRLPSGYVTPIVGGTIERLLIGDCNRDHVVNDRDLSILSRAFRKYTPFADFNEDGKVDDFDLSLLASHWKQSY